MNFQIKYSFKTYLKVKFTTLSNNTLYYTIESLKKKIKINGAKKG
jgi:hypothetical protein